MQRRPRRLLVFCLLGGVAAGVVLGLTVVFPGKSSQPHESVISDAPSDVPRWVEKEHLPRAAVRGATVFATAGCTACHTYAGSGHTALHAPDLTTIGARHLGVAFFIRHLECPSCVNPGSPMPHFDSLGHRQLRELAVFLEASHGIR